MSVNVTSISWDGTPNPAWGLLSKIGPFKQTPKDQKALNSRAGGPHSGHANFFYTIRPSPNNPTGPEPPKYINDGIITSEDFAPPKGLKVPGINRAGSTSTRNITGKRVEEIEKQNSLILENKEQGGLGKQEENSIIAREVVRPTVVTNDDIWAANSRRGSAVTRSSIASSARESATMVESPLAITPFTPGVLADEGVNIANNYRNPRGTNTYGIRRGSSRSSYMSED